MCVRACREASRDMQADMPKLFRRRHAYNTENIAVAVDVMIRRVVTSLTATPPSAASSSLIITASTRCICLSVIDASQKSRMVFIKSVKVSSSAEELMIDVRCASLVALGCADCVLICTQDNDHAGHEKFHGCEPSHLEQFTSRSANRNSFPSDVRSTSEGPPVWLIGNASEDYL